MNKDSQDSRDERAIRAVKGTQRGAHPGDAVRPIAVDVKGITKLFPVSVRSWRRLDSSGKIPRGFMLGGHKLWRIADLEQWAALGFPSREEYEHWVGE